MWLNDPWSRIRFSPADPPTDPPPTDPPPTDPPPTDPPPASGAFDANQLSPDVRVALSSKEFKTWDDVGKSYLELEKSYYDKIGKQGLVLPGDDADAAEWDPVWQALGRPEKVEDYDLGDFKPPEGLHWSEDVQKEMMGVFHSIGLNNRQTQHLTTKYAEIRAAELKAINEKAAQAADEADQELRRNLGSAYDAKLNLANRVAMMAFGNDFEAAKQIRLPDGTFLLDNPMLVKAFMTVGDTIAEDGGTIPDGGGRQTFAMTPEDAQAEIKKLKADADFNAAFLKSNHPDHEAAVKRMTRLQQIVNSAKAA